MDQATGRAVYGADVRLPGMLYGKVLRSPHAHALVKRIDTSKALALPGVHAVLTHADFPEPLEPVMQTVRGPQPTKWDSERIMAALKAAWAVKS